MKYKKSLFIFRRDLRLQDNTALLEALKNSKEVLCCFIFSKKQIEENSFRSDNALEFMLKSLDELDLRLNEKNSRLHFFYGDEKEIIKKIHKNINIEAIYSNKDYTVFARNRDEELSTLCDKLSIDFHQYHDYLLLKPTESLKKDGTPYTIFTPFYKNKREKQIRPPENNTFSNYFKSKIEFSESKEKIFKQIIAKKNTSIALKGGREEAFRLINSLKDLKQYNEERDFPELEKTSFLSAHHKFGTISIRESYYLIKEELGENHQLLRQLFWRDFYTLIAYYFPKVLKGESFQRKYDSIKWENNREYFEKWKQGKTGFPIVDAGMRELNTTGFMHNRVRMIVSSFLVKDLLIDWRWGEHYFAQKLIDYDPSVNNGSWQWAASTGCDAQPYFRIFNPWRQQKRFDPQCKYIKKWVKELENVSCKDIENLENKNRDEYYKKIVDHKEQAKKAKKLYLISSY